MDNKVSPDRHTKVQEFVAASFNSILVWKNKRLRRKPKVIKEDLAPYRQLALQLMYEQTESPSALFVTPKYAPRAAQSCVILASCMADALRKPLLLIDVSIAGSEIPDFLGRLNRSGESGHVPERNPRFSEEEDGWYFSTREGAAVGPYEDLKSAKHALEEFIINNSFCKLSESVDKQGLDAYITSTHNPNLSFMSANSSRIRRIKTNENNEVNENITVLMNEIQHRFEYILFYGGSLLESSLSLALAPHAGSVLLAATENETSLADYDNAQNTLQLCQARKISPILIRATKDIWSLDIFKRLK